MKEKYEAYIVNDIILVLPNDFKHPINDNPISIDIAIEYSKSNNIPFSVFGIPKEIKKHISSKTQVLKSEKPKFKNTYVIVQPPSVGSIIDVFEEKLSEKTIKENFKNGLYSMSIEEAIVLQDYLKINFFVFDVKNEKINFYINSSKKY